MVKQFVNLTASGKFRLKITSHPFLTKEFVLSKQMLKIFITKPDLDLQGF